MRIWCWPGRSDWGGRETTFRSLLRSPISCWWSSPCSSTSLRIHICFSLTILSTLCRNHLSRLGTSLWSFFLLFLLFLREMRADHSFCGLVLSRSSGRKCLDLFYLELESQTRAFILMFLVSWASLRRCSCVEELPTLTREDFERWLNFFISEDCWFQSYLLFCGHAFWKGFWLDRRIPCTAFWVIWWWERATVRGSDHRMLFCVRGWDGAGR